MEAEPTRTGSDPSAAIRGALLQRMSGWQVLSLRMVADPRGAVAPADPATVDAFMHYGEAGCAWLRSDAAAVELGTQCLRWLRTRNQFADVDPRSVARLYARALQDAADLVPTTSRSQLAAGLTSVLEAHRGRLGRLAVEALGERPVEVVAAEYTPTTQWQALALGQPRGPLLDVGCGTSAGLVRALRARGVDAHGLDLEAPQDVAQRADWLDASVGRGRWVTIVSHLAFSLHFLHHHLRATAAAERYAAAYVRLLLGLAPGGVFAYVPSLPFVEQHLGERWHVVRRPVASTGVSTSHVRRVA